MHVGLAFGARYDIPAFQDAVAWKLWYSTQANGVKAEAVKAAYEGRASDSIMRRYLVAEIASEMYGGNQRRRPNAWSIERLHTEGLLGLADFMAGFLRSYLRRSRGAAKSARSKIWRIFWSTRPSSAAARETIAVAMAIFTDGLSALRSSSVACIDCPEIDKVRWNGRRR